MKTDIYNQNGEKAGSIELPEEIFDLPWNPDLVHQVAVAMQANQRKGTAHTKGRGEVRGGGRKPWRQKGTGRARHGSIRSPIWRGGGVTFGPTKEKIYAQKINDKMRKKALLTALSQKARDKEVLVLEELDIKEPKTKEAAAIIKSLAKIKNFEAMTVKKKNAALFLLTDKIEKIMRGFRNIPGVNVIEARNINLLDVLSYKFIIFPKNLIKKAQEIWHS